MMVTQVSELIGTQVKVASLSANTPVFKRFLERPFDVNKGSTISIAYVHPHMSMTTKGKALENGRRGDVISVKNLDSQKTIQVTIDGAAHGFVEASVSPEDEVETPDDLAQDLAEQQLAQDVSQPEEELIP
jgi:flagella basal body P-ring formation protein FlgA